MAEVWEVRDAQGVRQPLLERIVNSSPHAAAVEAVMYSYGLGHLLFGTPMPSADQALLDVIAMTSALRGDEPLGGSE